MNVFFNKNLVPFFCNQQKDGYFLRGERGVIDFQLKSPYIEKKNLFSTMKYSFDIFTAYSPTYFKKTGLPRNTEEDDKDPFLMANEYIEKYDINKSFIEGKYLKNHKKYQNVLKMPIEKIDDDYFNIKKKENKEIIHVYVDIKFQKHDTSIDTGLLDEGEDISVLEELGYNTKMPPDEEIVEELERINIKKIYNITLPFTKIESIYPLFDIDPLSFFTGIKNMLEANAEEFFLPQSDYINIISSISKQGFAYNFDGKYSLNKINEIRKTIESYGNNPLMVLLNDIFFSFIDILTSKKYISICHHCGNLMSYKKGKKFCSYRFEGKDCGKSARNKRAYLKRKHLNRNTY